jgi:hypothetical protein
MINFRFHLVSLVAVFLALGLGILVGSTVIDQGIVNRLDSEISHVRKENSKVEAASKTLSQQNKQLQQYLDEVAPFVGDGRLEQQSIAVIAEKGVDSSVVKQTEALLRGAGADVPAVLRLEDPWKLDTETHLQALQSALGLQGSAPATRDAALNLLARRLAKAPRPTTATSTTTSSTTTTTTTTTTAAAGATAAGGGTTTSVPATVTHVDALDALEKAGFLSVVDGDASQFDTFPTYATDVLVITGDDSDFAGTDLAAALVRATIRAKLPTVVAAAYDEGNDPATAPQRGAALASVLDDQVLSRETSTVDDLELQQGRIAVVLALETIGSGNSGHYGYGSGASAPLPPHRS